jgi:hypothetical protein
MIGAGSDGPITVITCYRPSASRRAPSKRNSQCRAVDDTGAHPHAPFADRVWQCVTSRMLFHFFGCAGKTLDEDTGPDVFAWAYARGLSGCEPSAVTIGARIARGLDGVERVVEGEDLLDLLF